MVVTLFSHKFSDGRTFVTVIRAPGVPASLHVVSDKIGDSGPLLIPYPNWETYENPRACNGITSVYRVTIDKCNRLWILDTGKIGADFICPAQLVVYNLLTDQLITKVKIPDHIARNETGNGLLITPAVETYGPNCEVAAVYIADVVGRGLIVWTNGRFIRLASKSFNPELRNSNYTIAGEKFFLDDGLFGLALTPEQYFHGNRLLFFRPLASRSIYSVPIDDLKSNNRPEGVRFFGSPDVLSSQATSMTFSDDGILFYGLTEDLAIGCWNLNRPLRPENLGIPLIDKQRLQFASGLKIFKNRNGLHLGDDQLLVFTNRLQKIMTGSKNINEINFRILRASVQDVVRGSVCENINLVISRNSDDVSGQDRNTGFKSISSIVPSLSSDAQVKFSVSQQHTFV
ncbi:hypothetical protein QAD02_023589 [Eretmocerus hayati]|uniref:Uncharacterized protein n=1 Tax=Eretmocerus hayati TaxID=131215 RepID=A0ACC2Q166_9HYME|nr:hypothetical protein QAD02_023589 [Eretmocerus hayati]